MRRSAFGYCGFGQPQPDMNMNYHRSHSEHVTNKLAGNPCHAAPGGAVQHHTTVHKESFKEVDGDDCYDPRRGHQQLGHRHHGNNNNNNHHGRHNGGSAHRYETYEETYSAGRHHGHGGGARRYESYEETFYEEEEEVAGSGGGYAQLKRGQRCA